MILKILLCLVLLACSLLGCPDDVIPPCTCRWIGYHACTITCSDVTNEVELKKSLHRMKDIKVPIKYVNILDSSINFMPSQAFKGLVFPKLSIVATDMGSLSDTDTAFVGLEDCLQELVLIECSFFSGWTWSQLRNLRSLRKLETTKAGLLEIDKDVKEIAALNITELFLTQGTISYIDDKAFDTFHNLESLSLKQNQIKTIKRSMFPNPAPKLKLIILSYNEIESLPKDMFTHMPNIGSIYLSDNKLITIDEDTFRPVWHQLKRFDFSGNPLRCDCRTKWILKVPLPRSMYVECEKPTHLKGVRVQNLAEKDLWC